MSTFGAIKTRIADELARADLSSQIALAVQDAITWAAKSHFWFNEVKELTFNTVASQEYYGSTALADIPRLSTIDALWLTVNGQRRYIDLRANEQLDRLAEGTPSTGEPYLYSRHADALRLYRVPDAVYPIYINGTSKLAALTGDSDANAWMVEGEQLIRLKAKAILYRDVIRDRDESRAFEADAEIEKRELLQATGRRVATGTVKPWGL